MALAGMALVLAGAPGAPARAGVTVVDDIGAKVTVAPPPLRIVSLTPGATEMLFAAGGGAQVIATVEYADVPAAARSIPRIGDVTAIDMERLIALHPDVVVVWPGGGNPAQTAELKRLGIPLYAQEADRLTDLAGSLRRLGALAGTQAAAERAAADLERRLTRLSREHRASPQPRVLLQVWNHPIYTVGGRQLMSDALRQCGARNAFDELRELSPVIDTEAVIARNPDIIVVVAPAAEGRSWLEDWRRFASLKAVHDHALIAIDDRDLSRLGPSVVGATEALCRRLDELQRSRAPN